MLDHRGKFATTYEGPYVVKKAFSEGALILADMDGHDFNMPTNSDAIIRYFAWRSLSEGEPKENLKGWSMQKESQKKESVSKYER